jgi:hypothetical protein
MISANSYPAITNFQAAHHFRVFYRAGYSAKGGFYIYHYTLS